MWKKFTHIYVSTPPPSVNTTFTCEIPPESIKQIQHFVSNSVVSNNFHNPVTTKSGKKYKLRKTTADNHGESFEADVHDWVTEGESR